MKYRIDYLEKTITETRDDVADTKKSVEWIKTQIELLKLKVALAGAIGGAIMSVAIAIITKHWGL